MLLSPSELADRAVTTLIVIGQILIARHFIRERNRTVLAILSPLWLVIAIDAVMNFTGTAYTAPFPAPVRSVLTAVALVWGVASFIGFSI